jgi:GNAT superfamily N-acetyltransferase
MSSHLQSPAPKDSIGFPKLSFERLCTTKEGVPGIVKLSVLVSDDEDKKSVYYILCDVLWRQNGGGECQNIGDIKVLAVDKQSRNQEGQLAWHGDVADIAYRTDEELEQMHEDDQACLSMNEAIAKFYTLKTRRVRKRHHNKRAHLERKTIVYISEFRLKDAWQARGLGSRVLELLHDSLGECLAQYSVSGNATLLLQPDFLNRDDNGRSIYEGNPPGEVRAATLRKLCHFYRKHGYEVWFEHEPRLVETQGTYMLMGSSMNVANQREVKPVPHKGSRIARLKRPENRYGGRDVPSCLPRASAVPSDGQDKSSELSDNAKVPASANDSGDRRRNEDFFYASEFGNDAEDSDVEDGEREDGRPKDSELEVSDFEDSKSKHPELESRDQKDMNLDDRAPNISSPKVSDMGLGKLEPSDSGLSELEHKDLEKLGLEVDGPDASGPPVNGPGKSDAELSELEDSDSEDSDHLVPSRTSSLSQRLKRSRPTTFRCAAATKRARRKHESIEEDDK